MKFNDAISGAALLALAIAVLVNVQSFPKIPGQNIGPGAFPGLLATLLAICAVLLIARGVREKVAHEPWIAPGGWLRSWPHLRGFLVTIGSLLFYVLASDALGFIACSIAIVATLVVHTAFYKGLRVPLPWGVLLPVAW